MQANLSSYAFTLDAKESNEKKLPSLGLEKKLPPLMGLGKAMVQQGRLQGEDNSYGRVMFFFCDIYFHRFSLASSWRSAK